MNYIYSLGIISGFTLTAAMFQLSPMTDIRAALSMLGVYTAFVCIMAFLKKEIM